jgi:Leucine-rich repeat (LRR) protein
MKIQSLVFMSLIVVSSGNLAAGSEPNPQNAGLFAQLPLDILSRITSIAQDCDEDCDCGCCGEPVLTWCDVCKAQATCKFMRKYFIHQDRYLEADFASERQKDETVPAFLNRVLVSMAKGALYPHKNPISLDLSDNSLQDDPHALEQFIHNLDTFGLANRIIEFSLNNNGLSRLPANINLLKNLEMLDFFSNTFGFFLQTGEPTTFDAIGSVESLQKLERLNVAYNHIKQLPGYISSMPALETLDISGNPLSLEELEKVCRNKSLRELHCTGIPIKTLPPSMTTGGPNGTGQLKTLALDVRRLPMDELEKICTMSQLEFLQLDCYQLPALPPGINKLNKLQTLYLSCNPHEFEDDEGFVKPNLSIADLRKLCTMANLEILTIDAITIASLPQEINNLKKLRRLTLCDSELPSQELTKICQLKQLISLNLTGNTLQVLPDDIRNLTNLTELDLTSNDLSPKELSKLSALTNLEKLSLGNNKLTSLPQELVALQHLKELNIWNNNIEEDEDYATLLSQLPADLKIVNEPPF